MFKVIIENGDGVCDTVKVATRQEVIALVPGFKGPMWWLDDLSEPFTYSKGDWDYTVERVA